MIPIIHDFELGPASDGAIRTGVPLTGEDLHVSSMIRLNRIGCLIGKSLLAILSCQLSFPYFQDAFSADQSGVASVYSRESGNRNAAGQKLSPETLTAAHLTLSFGTKVKVTNKSNGRSVVVTINDRGPFVHGRIIDVSPAAARLLGFSGLTQVTITPEDPPVTVNAAK